MKITFDLGTKENIDPGLVAAVLDSFYNDVKEDMKVSKMSMYFNIYDADGYEIVYTKKKTDTPIDYIVRGKEYSRRPKGVELVGPIIRADGAAVAFMYRKLDLS